VPTAIHSPTSDANSYLLLTGLLQLAMTWIAVLKVDDLGRRPLLIGGVSGIVCMLLLSRTLFSLSLSLSVIYFFGSLWMRILLSISLCYRLFPCFCFLLITNFLEVSLLLLLQLCFYMSVATRQVYFPLAVVTQVYFSCNYRMEYWHSIIFGLQKLIEYSIRCCSHYPTAPFKRRKRRKRRN